VAQFYMDIRIWKRWLGKLILTICSTQL